MENGSKLSCSSVYLTCDIVCENTLSLCHLTPQQLVGSFESAASRLDQFWIFYLITSHHKRGKKPPLQLFNKYRHQTGGMQGVRSSLLVTTHCSTINKERKLMRKGKTEQEKGWVEFDVPFQQVISGKAKKGIKKKSRFPSYCTWPFHFHFYDKCFIKTCLWSALTSFFLVPKTLLIKQASSLFKQELIR